MHQPKTLSRADFLYLTSESIQWQAQSRVNLPVDCLATFAATIITKMNAQKIGRALGIGLRVAGRVAGERLSGGAERAHAASALSGTVVRSEAARRVTTAVARGAGGFFAPFRRAGAILWLEMTGAFFLLFVLAFLRAMWRVRASWMRGPEHMQFLGYTVLAGVFLYLGASSFWRARRR